MDEMQFAQIKIILEHIEDLLTFLSHKAVYGMDQSFYRMQPCDPESARAFD